jgi:pyruvate kinase
MPHSALTLNAFTKEDERHLAFGLQQKVDFVGISFVGDAQDINRVRAFCRKREANPFLIAKIERRQALNNLPEIVEAADGIMVARGDLGVEVPFSEIPGLQKMIVSSARQKGKPVIVATQVLESMVQNPRPTRAEATDIANAVLEGADAIMLSGETATGKYPRESVKALSEVIQASEKTSPILNVDFPNQELSLSDVIAHEACHIAERIRAKLIVIPSRSGETVERVSRFRPSAPVLAIVKTERLRRRLCLYWGVHTGAHSKLRFPNTRSAIKAALLREKFVRPGDIVLFVSGDAALPVGDTSMMQAMRIF